ncbi:methylated-DNA--[protein]-cysteine S-methyltransferase [Kiloniella laminariae]|uniref:Methylated-DNA--protein-cysteine methyltransferase n=1 Tax=Kiloniella laminariae TaxID=454162 RepID=A0ABT4LJC8_9PROT|nr:methylated-DNA--[protein]-cysteine S-methyltransferase [Kiloniella laminariae]MCZ4281177.1 methylated-DNA--[protein]-cysteine S-methyltransferase [Kiloniella laminariae]
MHQLSFSSPQGYLDIAEEDGKIVSLTWLNESDELHRDETALLLECEKQILEYFHGKRQGFDDIPLNPKGTSFQKNVWDALYRIPYASLKTYGDIAREVGSVARAVGGACGANPIPIIIPCHRIIAGNKGLGGFSGGKGTSSKLELLALEGVKIFEENQPALPGL